MCPFHALRLPFLALFLLLAASTIQSVQPHDDEHAGVRFINDKIYFQASSVKAIFRDGDEYENDSIHYNSTIIGDYLSFLHKKREARLYFIPPELDWKKNETYDWKLNQAWMSDDYYGWVFWNVNGFINSQLQLSEHKQVFHCDHVEFTFWHNSPKGRFGGNEGKLVMENVEMAAFLPTDFNEASHTIYNPCEGRGKCRAMNGSIMCGSGSSWKYGTTLLSFIVAVVIVAIYNRTTTDTNNYDRIAHQEDATELDSFSSSHEEEDNASQGD